MGRRTAALTAALLLLAGCASCDRPTEPVAPEAKLADATVAKNEESVENDLVDLPQTREFMTRARAAKAEGERLDEPVEYLRSLDPALRIGVAAQLARKPDADVAHAGIGVLVASDEAEGAAEALAYRIVTVGDDPTRYGYWLAHIDESESRTAEKAWVQMHRYVLERFAAYDETSRQRAAALLLPDAAGRQFSPSAAEERVAAMEAKLKGL